MIEIMPLLALVYEKQGQTDKALHLLRKAIKLAEPGGWMRPFVESGPAMEDLLLQLQQQNEVPGYCKTLLAAFKDDSQKTTADLSRQVLSSLPQPDPSFPAEPLTTRELEILEQLLQGKSNKEIGEQLFISIYTVKTHLRNIYKKFDVTSRLQAVNKAMAAGYYQPERLIR
jgi:LuxR family maltose regulon positive regulatory protein